MKVKISRRSKATFLVTVEDDAGEILELSTLRAYDQAARRGFVKRLATTKNVDAVQLDRLFLAALDGVEEQAGGSDGQTKYDLDERSFFFMRDTGASLANFFAEITAEDVFFDEDHIVRREYEIVGQRADGVALPAIRVPAAEFDRMQWTSMWGAQAIVEAGSGYKDHLRAAIQHHSKDYPQRKLYMHTGWVQTDTGWRYLHHDGSIGAEAQENSVSAHLPSELQHIALPASELYDESDALRASLSLLDLGERRITIPILASIYRAPLGRCDFSLFCVGQTGTFKTATAMLAQQHYGPSLDYPPLGFGSTANATELMLHMAKDTLQLVDEFKPGGSPVQRQNMHQHADRILRGVANGTHRQRMDREGNLQNSFGSRSLVLATGEEVPDGQSLVSRMLVVDFGRNSINVEQLTRMQELAANGTLSAAMAIYLRHIAPRYSDISAALPNQIREWIPRFQSAGQHPRTARICANLMVGFTRFLQTLHDLEVINDQAYDAYLDEATQVFQSLGQSQAREQQRENPTTQVLSAFVAMLSTGTIRLAELPRANPDRRVTAMRLPGTQQVGPLNPNSAQVGWFDEEFLYLEPHAMLREIRRTLGPATPSQRQLSSAMRDLGILEREPSQRGNTMRLRGGQFDGGQVNVWCIRRSIVFGTTESPAGGGAAVISANQSASVLTPVQQRPRRR